MPLVLVPLFVLSVLDDRAPTPRCVGARLLCGRTLRAAPARLRRRHRAAGRVYARHAPPDRRVALDARRVLDRATSALRREHARGAGVRAAVGHVVPAVDRRAAELHLSRAHCRSRRGLSSERVRRQLSRVGERRARDDPGVRPVPAVECAVPTAEGHRAGVARTLRDRHGLSGSRHARGFGASRTFPGRSHMARDLRRDGLSFADCRDREKGRRGGWRKYNDDHAGAAWLGAPAGIRRTEEEAGRRRVESGVGRRALPTHRARHRARA